MSSHALLNAVGSLSLMLVVAGGYVWLARRLPRLWHPLSILLAVTLVSVVVTILGEVLFQSNGAGVIAALRRSLVGGLGWGAVIAIVVWGARRLFKWRRRTSL
jgi:hypothetical protein